MGYYSEQISIVIKGRYPKDYPVREILKYVTHENYKDAEGKKHTGSKVRFYGGYGVLCKNMKTMERDMERVRKHFKKDSGRKFYHVTITPKYNIPAGKLDIVAKKLCKKYFHDYQSVYGIHESTGRPHIHICLSSVSIHDGKKFQVPYPYYGEGYKNFHRGIERFIVEALEKEGINIVI